MVKHKKTGAKGEEIAAEFLKNNGYNILHTNWTAGKKEVDIIATVGDLLVFVEVKTRRDFTFGYPEEAVTVTKQSYIKAAADAFLEANTQYLKLRFDIISIIYKADKLEEILHLEDAFY
ncbi:MAG TPA: YraN family protein [Flavipsychrobacter sp.]|nr:YraN family protein [Flavipsychrobacter sp.]